MRKPLAILAALLAVTSPAGARPLQPEERVLLGEVLAVWEAVGDDVWSKWTETPMRIVYVTDDVEFGIGFQSPLEGAESSEPLGRRTVCVRPRTFDQRLAASFFVKGRPAVILGTPEALGWDPSLWVAKAIHEMFHVLQYTRGDAVKVARLAIGPENDPSWQLEYPFPYESDPVLRSLHPIGYCLHAAMTAATDTDARYAAGTAADATVALRAVLAHETGDDVAFRYARFQANREGVAYWTEREVVRRAAARYEATPEFLALPGAVPFGALWKDEYRQAPSLVKHLGRAAPSRTLFYHLGFGFASVLERLDPGWRERYFDPDAWIDDMLPEGGKAAP